MGEVDRRQFLISSATAASLALLPASISAATKETHWPRFGASMVIDSCGSPGRTSDADPHPPLDAGELADIRESGVTAMNLTVGSVGRYAKALDETVEAIAFWDREIAANPITLMKITHGAQLDEAKRNGRMGIIYGFQDTTMYGENLDHFDLFHDFGVRIVQLTYNRRNLIGDGCLEPGNAGLSKLGREMVAKMNERGTLVDLSHCGQRTTREGIETSRKPVAITHSGCVAVADMPRNKHDEELRLLAERGGVVGIYIMPYLRAQGQVMAEDVIKHIEYAVKVCGEDHVGIGTDGTISGVKLTPEFKKLFAAEVAERQKRGISAPGERADSYTFALDLNSPKRMQQIAWMLSQRGHGDDRIEKILGGNFARLFRETIV
jgi:membrane dipeptidase